LKRVVPFVLVSLLSCNQLLAQSLPAGEASDADDAGEIPERLSPTRTEEQISLGRVWRDLGRDFRNLPSVQNAVILGAGGGMSVWVHSEDAEITQHWSDSLQLDTVFEPGAFLGSGWVQIGGAVGTYVVGRKMDSLATAWLGADLIRSQTINAVLTQGIKLAVRRPRPDGAQFSFPSGHASATFTTATVLQRHFGWKVGGPAYAVAGFVGASRLQENRHYMSDVLFGAAIGIVSGRTATIGRGAATFSLSPLVAPGAVGFELIHRAHR
jgi:membrane-associated phospholipid phosphatase